MDASSGKPHPAAFEFSSADKAQANPLLSVFLKDLTSRQQAKKLVSASEDSTLLFLPTDKVRAITVAGNTTLDVVWDEMKLSDLNGIQVKVTLPGSDGHCGISNAYPSDIHNVKIIRNRIRDELVGISRVEKESGPSTWCNNLISRIKSLIHFH